MLRNNVKVVESVTATLKFASLALRGVALWRFRSMPSRPAAAAKMPGVAALVEVPNASPKAKLPGRSFVPLQNKKKASGSKEDSTSDGKDAKGSSCKSSPNQRCAAPLAPQTTAHQAATDVVLAPTAATGEDAGTSGVAMEGNCVEVVRYSIGQLFTIKPYVCEHPGCGASFRNRQQLLVHGKVHQESCVRIGKNSDAHITVLDTCYA